MTSTFVDRAVEATARKQRGASSRSQALHAGASTSLIDRRLESGVWVELGPAVYALPSHPGTFLRQCWAAVLGSPGAAVAGLAAAHVLDLPDFRVGRPEIVLPPNANSRSGLARVHRFDSPRLTRVKSLPVTTVAQTVFDIASRVSVDRLERAVDDSILTNSLSVDDLDERLAFYTDSRRAGLPVLRGLINERRADGWTPAESELERRADRVMRRLCGEPTIVAQATFPWLERGTGRVDRLIDGVVLVEFDGRRWHARVKAFDRDRWRDNLAVANGLLPLRFTYLHVTTRPAEVQQVIEQTCLLARKRLVA